MSRDPHAPRDPLSLAVHYHGKLDDGRFDWTAPRVPRCAKCADRHTTEIACEAFQAAQAERFATDPPAFFWHAGYRKAQESLFDTEPLVRPGNACQSTFRSTTVFADRKKNKPPGRPHERQFGKVRGPRR